MIKDRRIYASLPAADFARAKTWYREKLGLEPVMEMEGGAAYRVGEGTGFFVYPTQFAGTAKNTAMGFETNEFDADLKDMRSKGVKFEDYDMPDLKTVNGVADYDGTRVAWFKDSEGNILALQEMMPNR
jgi:catechol 2,3-dioxygenase-like lactoylglutathione lyase family enzyme